MRNTKIFAVIAAFAMITVMTACSKSSSSETSSDTTASSTEASTEASTAETTAETTTEAPTEPTTEEPTEPPIPPKEKVEVSLDIYSTELSFDGFKVSLDVDREYLASNGWDYDLAEYGFEDGFKLDNDSGTVNGLVLRNETYVSPELHVLLNYKNHSGAELDITECPVSGFTVDAENVFLKEEGRNLPELHLPRGITWGSTLDEVKEAYGQPREQTENEDGEKYVTLRYSQDMSTFIVLKVHEKYGLMYVDYSDIY